MRLLLRILLIGLAAAPAARAHDFWIEPSTYTPTPGQRVAVRLRVADHFPGDPFPRNAARIERFAVLGGGAEAAVPGVDGTDPAGYLVADKPGLYQIVYDSNHASIELAGEKFEQHLAEQGLERIGELRKKDGRSAAAAKEIYSRSVKALIAVGGGSGEGFDRPAGLPLELIAEQDPFRLKPGEELPVRLLYQGKPLAGAWVEARNPRRSEERVSGRTDREGRVRLRLASAGPWLIKSVHMVPAPKDSGADWESFWASLTFETATGR
ncbi:MAG TPA: DUF4198 domain-containing protein [Thermoanaerobaculia bacterium]|nr:DUF4198 domain-containing protein [Thermoanaerobaculia bacterium]